MKCLFFSLWCSRGFNECYRAWESAQYYFFYISESFSFIFFLILLLLSEHSGVKFTTRRMYRSGWVYKAIYCKNDMMMSIECWVKYWIFISSSRDNKFEFFSDMLVIVFEKSNWPQNKNWIVELRIKWCLQRRFLQLLLQCPIFLYQARHALIKIVTHSSLHQ